VLEVIAGRRAGRGWWDEYADLLPAGTGDFLALETAGSRLLVYEPQMVPALLQTEPYALALASADPGLPAGSRRRAAEAIMIRQQALLDQGRLEITVVLGEAALRQAVGGAAVMRAQLGQLAAFGEDHPQVTVQVVPFSGGAHPPAARGRWQRWNWLAPRPWAWSTSAACPAASTWRTRQLSPAMPRCSGTCR